MKENLKEKVKAKAKAVKDKAKALKAKAKKRGARKVAAGLVALGALCMAGCMDTAPASRATTNTFGDTEPTVKIDIGKRCRHVSVSTTVRTTFGDGAIASADSTGSTETQTATPTLDIRTRVDARYNDALAAASTGSKSVIEGLSDVSKNAVLAIMAAKGSGTIAVKKSDGTDGTVKCADGQCEYTAD